RVAHVRGDQQVDRGESLRQACQIERGDARQGQAAGRQVVAVRVEQPGTEPTEDAASAVSGGASAEPEDDALRTPFDRVEEQRPGPIRARPPGIELGWFE